MKLKYDCPAPSKSGKDVPLWKTATQCFLKIVAPIAFNLKELDPGEFLNRVLIALLLTALQISPMTESKGFGVKS